MPTNHLDYVEVAPKILYFGTPVALLTTVDANDSVNLAAISSVWALGWNLVLGLGADGATARNLASRPEIVVNMAGPDLMGPTDEIGYLTAMSPVPTRKRAYVHHDPDKIATAGFVTIPSVRVKPPRIGGCHLQFEGIVRTIRPVGSHEDQLLAVDVRVLTVHAASTIVVPGTDHINPAAWKPLIYNFRHYYTLGEELGYTRRSDTPSNPSRRVPQRATGEAYQAAES